MEFSRFEPMSLGFTCTNVNVIDGGNRRVPHFNSFSNVACRRLEFFKPYSRAINLHTAVNKSCINFPRRFSTESFPPPPSPAIFASNNRTNKYFVQSGENGLLQLYPNFSNLKEPLKKITPFNSI